MTNTRAAYGSATYTTTTTGGRGGTATTTRGTGRATATTKNLTVDGFNGGTTGYSISAVMPHYSASLRFQTPARPAGELLGELKSMLVNAESIPSRQKVDVQVEGRTVTLKGEVTSDDERRAVENLVRLTPGWSQIHNELTVKP